MNAQQWCLPPQKFTAVAEHEIHIWRASLDLSTAQIEQLWPLLSPEEQQRALRYKFAQHQRRFTAARGRLRIILSRYIAESPDKIRFVYNAFGKPQLDNKIHPTLEFNASDSNEMALFAISTAEPVGVDLECMQKEIEAEAIAERFFSAAEIQQLQALPVAEKIAGFFKIWTRKEAFIKALGQGLSFPLKDFDVNLNEPAALLAVRRDEYIADEWLLFTLHPGEDYIGALAVRGKKKTLKLWEFNSL